MLTMIQAYAEGLENNKSLIKLRILTIDSTGTPSVEENSYVIPDNKSSFINSVNNIYSRENPPTNISKDSFRSNIINYTLNISKVGLDYNSLNDYYTEIFTKDIDFDSLMPNVNLLESIDEQEDLKQKDLDLYQSTKETEKTYAALSSHDDGGNDGEKDEAEIFEDYNPSQEIKDNIIQGSYTNVNNPSSYITPDQYREENVKSFYGDKPVGGAKRPVVQQEGLSTNKIDSVSNLPQNISLKLRGIGGDRLIEPIPEPLYYPGDSYLQGENNAGIICSRDEIYRQRGHTKSGACYIYAGRSSNNIKSEKSADGSSEPQILRKPNDLISDASYVYLSQKSDVDSLLQVAGGTYSKVIKKVSDSSSETRQGISLAAVKADDVVIMSRVSGIRLITGTDSKSTKGGDQFSKFGIDLIAGNDDTDLQPLVKGDNLQVYLETLSNTLDELRAVVYDFISSQMKFNAEVGRHDHYDPFSILMGFMSTNGANPLAVNGGKSFISPQASSAFTISALEGIRQQSNIINIMQNRTNNDINAFSKIGAYKILSEKNRTN